MNKDRIMNGEKCDSPENYQVVKEMTEGWEINKDSKGRV